MLHLDAGGTLRAPAVQASLDADGLALAGIPFTRFAIPFIRVEAPAGGGLGRIQIQNARLEEDDRRDQIEEMTHYLARPFTEMPPLSQAIALGDQES